MNSGEIIGLIHNEPIPYGQPNWESSADVMVQVEAIEEALTGLGYRSVRIGFTRDLSRFVDTVRKQRIASAFNLCESVDDDPQLIAHPAAVLELLGIPYSGSTPAALQSTTDKYLFKLVLRGAGIPTPGFLLFDGQLNGEPHELHYPVILKPQLQDASIGIDQDSVLGSAAQLTEKLPVFYEKYGPILIEEFIHGREFNVSVMGNSNLQVMPVAEIDFSGLPKNLFPIVGYQAKWDPDSIEYRETRRTFPVLDDALYEKVKEAALRCYRLFGLRDYGRVDMRVGAGGKVFVLEINANPCLSPDAGFAAAVLQAGLDYRGMVRRLIELLDDRGI